ncbi:MAG: hypothetical protein M1835_000642 [Candelina submexicana]|nr:MAG: hypothetical protein M1835_000642 [Candelina submexicana]
MDSIFICALVRAGHCKKHSIENRSSMQIPKLSGVHTRFCSRRKNSDIAVALSRDSRTSFLSHERVLAAQREFSREDYKSIVDIYTDLSGSRTALLPQMEQENPHITAPGFVAPAESCLDYPVWPARNESDQLAIGKLIGFLNDDSTSHETIYHHYRALPAPRVPYLFRGTLRLLFHRLSVVERKDEASMLRYLSIVDDVKSAGMTLTCAEWSSAIAFAGRCFARVTSAEVESALHLWKEMETQAGVKGTDVTFNILFDIATKAGKFILAEMILREMRTRKLAMNRFAHVGLIYYHGVKGDGDGVRKAYVSLVESGEIVDTVVLNCVIASLLRTGEAPAAEQVYERMKRMHSEQTGRPLPPSDWRSSRELGRSLLRAAKVLKDKPERLQELQRNTSIAPNLATLQILISYHCIRTGEYELVARWLDEMQPFDIPLHGSIFVALLKGFTIHGGIRYTSWTRARLESVWAAYHRAVDERISNVYVGKRIIIWAIKAFGKCAGKERTLEVWDQIQGKWTPKVDEAQVVDKVLRDVLAS